MGTPAEKLSLGMCKRIRTDDIRSLPLTVSFYKRESYGRWSVVGGQWSVVSGR